MFGCLEKFKEVDKGHQSPKTKNRSQHSSEAGGPSAPADSPYTAPPPYSTQCPILATSTSDSDSQVDEVAALVASRLQGRDATQDAAAAALPHQPETSQASQGPSAPLAGSDATIPDSSSEAAVSLSTDGATTRQGSHLGMTLRSQDTTKYYTQSPWTMIGDVPFDKRWTHAEVRAMLQDAPSPIKHPASFYGWLIQVCGIYNCVCHRM
ncbi:hypothetical protein chiPu_0026148 [Chiloscyllium punctatum]|uniref:Uncharacterized protein n=1 Tax=Chiloscyllium punctatum TaxID=137246 RepID=A0A401TI87_CHIPU|nr:hypothetical protein [Chiloscyllium punctatum]